VPEDLQPGCALSWLCRSTTLHRCVSPVTPRSAANPAYHSPNPPRRNLRTAALRPSLLCVTPPTPERMRQIVLQDKGDWTGGRLKKSHRQRPLSATHSQPQSNSVKVLRRPPRGDRDRGPDHRVGVGPVAVGGLPPPLLEACVVGAAERLVPEARLGARLSQVGRLPRRLVPEVRHACGVGPRGWGLSGGGGVTGRQLSFCCGGSDD